MRYLKLSLLSTILCVTSVINNSAYSIETQFEVARNNIKNYGAIFPHAGLENIGATCYMNATLQCLANDTTFVKLFLKEVKLQYKTLKQKSINSNEYKLVLELANVMQKLWTLPFDKNGNFKKNTYYAAYEFMKILEKCNPLFKGGTPCDSKDLLLYLFETIHKVLGYKGEDIEIQGSSMQYISECLKNYSSCVSNSFYFVKSTKVTCNSCGYTTNSYQIANSLISPLEEVRKMKVHNNLMQMQWNNNFIFNNNNIVTLYDCFAYDQRIGTLTGSNMIYCKNCKQSSNAVMKDSISYVPNTFAIILNRGKGNVYDVRMNIPEQDDLQKYVVYNVDGKNYFLSSVVCHIKGGNGNNGYANHFITFARTTPNSPWVRYNDGIVTVEKQEQINDILSGKSNNIVPYILFYKKME